MVLTSDIGCHLINIAGGRNLLDDHKKGSVKGYITLVDLVVQVGHYIIIGTVSNSHITLSQTIQDL
jgi:hypothetical protein